MPMPLLNSYLKMMPRLEAEQSLRAVAISQIGSGSAGRAGAKWIQRWIDQARGGAMNARRQLRDPRAIARVLGLPMAGKRG